MCLCKLSCSIPILVYLLTYSMEQSPYWKADQFSASQEIPRMLWKTKIHDHIHKCPPPVPNLSQLDPVLSLGRTKGSGQVRELFECFVIWYFQRQGVVSTSPNFQAGGPPLVGCPRLLIQYIPSSYPPYLPQPTPIICLNIDRLVFVAETVFCNPPPNRSKNWIFYRTYQKRQGVVSTSPNSRAGGPHLVGCPRPLIQYIPSYPPYLP